MGSRLVALIEEQAALVARAAAPAHDLLESRVALLLLAGGGAHQRHVRGEEHARLHLLTMAQALVALVEALAAVVDRHVAAEVAQVTHGVDAQVSARREPDVTVAAARDVVEHDRRQLPPLAHARAVAKEEACPRARDGAARGRPHLQVALAGERDRLDLQARELAARDQLVRERVQQRVAAVRRGRRGEGRGFGDVGRVFAAGLRVGRRVLGEDLARGEPDGVRLLRRALRLLRLVRLHGGDGQSGRLNFRLAGAGLIDVDPLLRPDAHVDHLQQDGRQRPSAPQLVAGGCVHGHHLCWPDPGHNQLLQPPSVDPEDADRLGAVVLEGDASRRHGLAGRGPRLSGRELRGRREPARTAAFRANFGPAFTRQGDGR